MLWCVGVLVCWCVGVLVWCCSVLLCVGVVCFYVGVLVSLVLCGGVSAVVFRGRSGVVLCVVVPCSTL